jgi:phosphatidyl-myo-inositol dimannoside synthase
MSTVRVLFVSHSFPPQDQPMSNIGGMQRLAVELHEALRRHPAVELSAFLLRTSSRSAPVRLLPFTAKLLRSLCDIVTGDRIDLVLFSSMVTATASLPALNAVRQRGAKVAAMIMGRDVILRNPVYQAILPAVLGRLDLVLAISQATATACRDRGVLDSRVRVVPCGVNPARFTEQGSRRDAQAKALKERRRAGHAGPEIELLLGSVGRHVRRKGFDWFVDRVMPQLPLSVHYWIGGQGPGTPAIRRARDRRSLRSRVHLPGLIDEDALPTFYRSADLFVMPNVRVQGDMEGFGLVMLEAGICGLPTIAANLDGIADVIEEGRNGHLVPAGDAEAFARTILSYRGDRDALDAASVCTRQHVEERFTWARVIERYVAAFEDTIDQGPG